MIHIDDKSFFDLSHKTAIARPYLLWVLSLKYLEEDILCAPDISRPLIFKWLTKTPHRSPVRYKSLNDRMLKQKCNYASFSSLILKLSISPSLSPGVDVSSQNVTWASRRLNPPTIDCLFKRANHRKSPMLHNTVGSSLIGGFPSQRASNTKSVPMYWNGSGSANYLQGKWKKARNALKVICLEAGLFFHSHLIVFNASKCLLSRDVIIYLHRLIGAVTCL